MTDWASNSRYTLQARLRTGAFLGTLPYRNLQGEWFLNRADQIRFELPLYHPKVTPDLLQEGLTEIWLFRKDFLTSTQKLIFAGPLWDTTASSKEKKVSCGAEGLESYFGQRTIDWSTTYNADAGDIAWALLNTSQGLTDGDLNIIKGTVQPSSAKKIVTTRRQGKTILDVWQELSNDSVDDGFDFTIGSGNRAFNVFYPYKGGISDIRLEWPGTISSYTVQRMGKWIASQVLIQGPDETFAVAQNNTTRAKYGVRQRVESYTNAPSTSALNARAGRLRDFHSEVRVAPTVVVRAEAFSPFDSATGIELGDKLDIRIQDGFINMNETMRLVGWQLTVGKQDQESYNLYLNDLREIG